MCASKANDICFVNSVFLSSIDSLNWLFFKLIFYYTYHCTAFLFFTKTIGIWSGVLFSCCYSAPINFIFIISNPVAEWVSKYTKWPPESREVQGATANSCGLGVMWSDFTEGSYNTFSQMETIWCLSLIID